MVAKSDTLDNGNSEFQGRVEKYELKNDTVNILLILRGINSKHIQFQLDFSTNNKVQHIDDLAELVLLEDSDGSMYVPEGTAIRDEATQKDYFCDSTFMYVSKNLNISFAREAKTADRLSLSLYNSKIPGINNNRYTLYNID